jgi:hypothetical protein
VHTYTELGALIEHYCDENEREPDKTTVGASTVLGGEHKASTRERNMSVRIWVLSFTFLAIACGKHNGAHSDGSNNSDGTNCSAFGATCNIGTDCCSGVCANGMCGTDPTACARAGAPCTANTDCCTTSCVNNQCSANQCTADGQTCGNDGECCSGKCNGTCTPLNPTCKTDGNPCGSGADCCSKFCTVAGTCGNGSFCVQDGDACAHDTDCCGGICNPGPGGLGTCARPVVGSTNCQAGVDGTVCGGCGDCCSRLCAPYQATGVMVCQPAEGCRVDGDLCKQDSDCCGAPGSMLPGDGNVHCLRANPADAVGICRNPMSCNPQGDVCHYKNYSTCGISSERNDCCACISTKDCCQLDLLGVPRCNALDHCQMTGDVCSNSQDCCNGEPCVPDQNGVFHCGASCSPTNGPCTSDADCCPGGTCHFDPGSTMGTCNGNTACSQDGQACSDTMPCCPGISCNVTGSNPPVACPPGMETGCTCFNPIF